MKRFLCVLLAASMVSLFGCASNPSASSTASSAPSAPASSSASSAKVEVNLTIAAAASLTDVTKDIAVQYKKVAPNVTLTFTYGSSGALQTQIEQGAPVDIFMSAAKKQMDALDQKKLIDTNTRKNLLENKVVLITPKDSTLGLKSFNDLATAKVKKIAVGDPKSVPAGQYANQVFTSLKIADKVRPKLNLGTDVRQVLTWVESGNVDCGVVYSTDAKTSSKVVVVCDAPAGSCDKVVYPVAVLKKSKQSATAEDFVKFMQGPEVATLFQNYGFTVVK